MKVMLVNVAANECKESRPGYPHYHNNVVPSEVQLDLFCHENQRDFTDCFYPEMYLLPLKVRVLRLHKRTEAARFDVGFVVFVLFQTPDTLMNTHASQVYTSTATRTRAHNRM